MERVFIFIDGSNFYHNLKSINRNTNINFAKFAAKITREVGQKLGRQVLLRKVYYYNAPIDASTDPTGASKQQRFFNRLSFITNFKVKLGRLEPRDVKCPICKGSAEIVCAACGQKTTTRYEEKEVDVTLAVDMLSFARNNLYDIAVLVSDDGDFASVLKELEYMGKVTVFAGFHDTGALRDASDVFIRLNRQFFRGI